VTKEEEMDEERKEKSFVVKDKRLQKEEEEKQEAPRSGDEGTGKERSTAPPEESANELPEPTFANLILSLSTTAMYHFGDFTEAVGRGKQVNLPAARHTIDLLAMLKTKTEGNLDEYESSLLDGLLFELRMRYVKEAGG